MYVGKYQVLCGVPLGAIAITAAIAVSSKDSMIVLRDISKGYGLNKLIEGNINGVKQCILIEDVTTTGASIANSIKVLKSSGISTIAVFVMCDRRSEAGTPIEDVPVHPITTLSEIQSFFINELTDRRPMLKKLKNNNT
jgi:uridine monophosphate synthetase